MGLQVIFFSKLDVLQLKLRTRTRTCKHFTFSKQLPFAFEIKIIDVLRVKVIPCGVPVDALIMLE